MINEHLSYSRLKSLLCPAKYYFYYILDIGIMNKYLLRGSLVHKYHELNFLDGGNLKINNERIQKDIDKFIEDFKSRRKIPIITLYNGDREEVLNYVKSINYNILYNQLMDIQLKHIKKNPEKPLELYIEHELKYKIDNDLFKYLLIIPDVLLNVNDSSYIIDIKTGNYYNSYDEQLYFYYYVAEKVVNVPNPMLMLYFVKNYNLRLITMDKKKAISETEKLLNLSFDYLRKHNIEDENTFMDFTKKFYKDRKLQYEFLNEIYKHVGSTICNWCLLENCACPIKSNISFDDATNIILSRYSKNIQVSSKKF